MKSTWTVQYDNFMHSDKSPGRMIEALFLPTKQHNQQEVLEQKE